jgi:hypothetical protein
MDVNSTAVCSDFTEFGGADIIIRYAYNRICRLQLETGALRTTSTTLSAVSAGLLTLPADLIEIRGVYADGQRLQAVDPREADLYIDDWQSNPSGDWVGYFMKPGNSLTLQLVPAITPSTFLIDYVYAPAQPTLPCAEPLDNFPFPHALEWIIKYGVLADMLGNDGEMQDIERAARCEQMFREGIEIVKLTLDGD